MTFDRGSGNLEFDETGLLIGDQTLNNAGQVRDCISGIFSNTQHGMFVVATSDSSARVLHHTDNAAANGPEKAFFQIADLGAGPAPQVGDFLFLM